MSFERYGRQRSYGRGVNLQELPTNAVKHFAGFARGYDSRDAREDVPLDSSPHSLDMEVSRDDRLIRAPGTTLVEAMVNEPEQLILHASLDERSELLLMAPPHLGVKSYTATSWSDEGLAVGNEPWTYTNYGGTLIFSKGWFNPVYSRELGGALAAEPTIPPADAYAVFAGRLWVGGAMIDGNYQPLGVGWSGLGSDFRDFEGLGAGYELLIDDMTQQGDKIIAMRPMGLDLMPIICRKSIWLARRSGLLDRPADLIPAVAGVGGVSSRCCLATRFGIVFLSDTGLRIFTGNAEESISDQINNDLLPLDLTQLHKYSLSYNPFTMRLYLHTPTETWVWDIAFQRWYKRSLVVRGGVVFPEQFDQTTWGELVGSWGDQTEMWRNFSPIEGEASLLFSGESPAQLVKEDSASESIFDVPMTPDWEFQLSQAEPFDRLFTTKHIYLEYEGGGVVRLFAPNINGDYVQITSRILAAAAVPRIARIPFISTGRGVGLRIQYGSGNTETIHAAVEAMERGPWIPHITVEDSQQAELLASGLIWRDNFERANGPVGADYDVDGVTAIVAGIVEANPALNAFSYIATKISSMLLEQPDAVIELFITNVNSLDTLRRADIVLLGEVATQFLLYYPSGAGNPRLAIRYNGVERASVGTGSGLTLPAMGQQRHLKGSKIGNDFRIYNFRDPATPDSAPVAVWVNDTGIVTTVDRPQLIAAPFNFQRWDDLRVYKNHQVRAEGLSEDYTLEVVRAGGSVAASAIADISGIATADLVNISVPYAGLQQVRVKDLTGTVIRIYAPSVGIWGGDSYRFAI